MRLALLQMTSGVDPEANKRAILSAIADAKAGGADMLFTPEMSGLLDRNRKRATPNIVVEDESKMLSDICAAAKEHGLWVNLGSLALSSGEDDAKWVNRGFMIDDQGQIMSRYDKIHLFDVTLKTGEQWRESSVYKRGEEVVLADTPWALIGLSICYDMRFADLYTALSNAGARILSIPAAFTVPTGKAHWHVLLRARAIESACFVVAAAQRGSHADGRETYGHSLVVDPWGEVLLDMQGKIGLGYCDIDLAQVDDVRQQIPALANRQKIGKA